MYQLLIRLVKMFAVLRRRAGRILTKLAQKISQPFRLSDHDVVALISL
jgi:hypothetical protein